MKCDPLSLWLSGKEGNPRFLDPSHCLFSYVANQSRFPAVGPVLNCNTTVQLPPSLLVLVATAAFLKDLSQTLGIGRG